jgi:hypothetical protein
MTDCLAGCAGPKVAWLAEVEAAFGKSGIQSFALEGVLGELQVRNASRDQETRPSRGSFCLVGSRGG